MKSDCKEENNGPLAEKSLTEEQNQIKPGCRKSVRIKDKVGQDKNPGKKEGKQVNDKSKPCTKLFINLRTFRKNSCRSSALSPKAGSSTELTQNTSSRIERVIPLEAQFIDHTNYTGKYRNMKPRYYLKVSKSAVHGYGLFAIRAIPKETFLIEYVGNQK